MPTQRRRGGMVRSTASPRPWCSASSWARRSANKRFGPELELVDLAAESLALVQGKLGHLLEQLGDGALLPAQQGDVLRLELGGVERGNALHRSSSASRSG